MRQFSQAASGPPRISLACLFVLLFKDFLYLEGRVTEKEFEGRQPPSAGSLLRRPQWPRLGRASALPALELSICYPLSVMFLFFPFLF